jgi:CRISPR/Cas system-associated exonuclease Cas4 (RecB family)
MTKYRSTSWSQIEKYRLCPRRWWYSKHRPDIEDPPTEPLLLGQECHDIAEAHYLGTPEKPRRHQDDHPAYQSTRLLLKDQRLPPRTSADIRVEYPADYNLGIDAAGIPVQGKMDLLYSSPSENLLEIWDWKSLSSWKTAKNEDGLERFGQMVIYGTWAFRRLPIESVVFVHGQIHTKREAARVVATRPLSRDHVLGIYPSLEAAVREMTTLYEVPEAADVPADSSQCRAFGRPCPYVAVCPRSIYAGLTADATPNHAVEGGVTMSLKDKLAARAAANATPAPAPAPAEAAPPPPAPPVRATGINPPDATAPDTSKAGSYVPPAPSAPPPPTPGEATATPVVFGAPSARLVLEFGGLRYEVNLPVTVAPA